jgi:hypothetical protein
MLLVKRIVLFVVLTVLLGNAAENAQVHFRGVVEAGFVSVLSHHIQFSKNGTDFDYVDNGGQDVLFPVTRFSAEMDVG